MLVRHARFAVQSLAALAVLSCSGGEPPEVLVPLPPAFELCPTGDCEPSEVAIVARLTHRQWQNTVDDLFPSIDAGTYADDFRADPVERGFLFDNDARALQVDGTLRSSYAQSAKAIAERATANEDAVEDLLGGERIGAFVTNFGSKVHRRPLSEEERQSYLRLADQAPALLPHLSRQVAEVRLVLEAMLQSPYFLYRFDAVGQEGESKDYHLASKLSYVLWDTMPDEELLAAVAEGTLGTTDGLRTQVKRLLASERSHGVLARFHDQAFELERIRTVSHGPDNFQEYAIEERQRFFEYMIVDQRAGLADMLSSRDTFVNSTLAKLYGLSGNFGSDFQKVTLPAQERSGFLTQLGFLAANALVAAPDPIHRGTFIARRIACMAVPAPPDEIPPLPQGGGTTNRERIESHTEAPGSSCAGCHSILINPFGFPFEFYDELGRYRQEDNGQKVDGTTTPFLGTEAVEVEGAVELANLLSQSEEVHTCYSRHWVEYALGRNAGPDESELVDALAARSLQGAPVQELLEELIVDEIFGGAVQ